MCELPLISSLCVFNMLNFHCVRLSDPFLFHVKNLIKECNWLIMLINILTHWTLIFGFELIFKVGCYCYVIDGQSCFDQHLHIAQVF